MKLRTQILMFLFLFGLVPLVLLFAINMPLVLTRIQNFYHGAYLQTLRADFRDLDQHLASRQEMLRLLAKLPEPGAVMDPELFDVSDIDDARANYVEWANRILDDQLDVTHVTFTDGMGNPQFWLERDPSTLVLSPTLTPPPALPEEFFDTALSMQPRSVLVSPIRVNREGGPFNFLTLTLVSPVVPQHDTTPNGLVYITVDVGGMARAYAKTLWAYDDGAYLQPPPIAGIGTNAFDDFPGLAGKFASHRLALWESPDGRQMIWVPMFPTEHGGPVWVGRAVDTSPLAAFQRALVLRALLVVTVAVLKIWLVARWFARRVARFGRELIEGIRHMLDDRPVAFNWRGPKEFRELGHNLNRLAEIHSSNTRNLRAHARELENSNRYKSEFLANVSHELRTPLNSILLLSKMLAGQQALPEDERRKAGVINKAGEDLKGLIDNILDLSRIEAGETVLNIEQVDPKGLIEDLLEMVRPQFDAKGLRLDFEVGPQAPDYLVSDPAKVQQILKNFLSNAVKFTDEGGITVTLEPQAVEDALPVKIRVRDTGIGIPASKRAIIFEAFKQADGATNRRYGGTGLGLNISRHLAQLLGGRIDVQSEPGQGSTFSLHLPREFENSELPANMPEDKDASTDEEAGVPAADFNGHTVLVVEHELERLLCLTPMLETWRLKVVGAQDLEEAREVLPEEPHCRTVILDLDMPADKACDTLRVLRESLGPEGIIIGLSVDCEKLGQLPCDEYEVSDCLTLPVDAQALIDSLSRLTGKN